MRPVKFGLLMNNPLSVAGWSGMGLVVFVNVANRVLMTLAGDFYFQVAM